MSPTADTPFYIVFPCTNCGKTMIIHSIDEKGKVELTCKKCHFQYSSMPGGMIIKVLLEKELPKECHVYQLQQPFIPS